MYTMYSILKINRKTFLCIVIWLKIGWPKHSTCLSFPITQTSPVQGCIFPQKEIITSSPLQGCIFLPMEIFTSGPLQAVGLNLSVGHSVNI